jgi:hypothetical protein
MRRVAMLGGLLTSLAVFAAPSLGQPERKPRADKLPEDVKKRLEEYRKRRAEKLKPFREALEKADRLELYSLDPEAEGKGKDSFHGWKVLGKVDLKDGGRRDRVVKAVLRGMEEGRKMAMCFDPRHGLRATRAGKTTDLVICFACSRTVVHAPGKPGVTVSTSKAPQAVLDKVLTEAKVPLPRPRKD